VDRWLCIVSEHILVLVDGERQARIPERHIFLFSALGGATGAYLGMQTYRHKTQHRSFKIGLPLMIAVHIILVILIVGVLM
jgi:uncharacterized membrane protein YsdA (DUF1294 family)